MRYVSYALSLLMACIFPAQAFAENYSPAKVIAAMKVYNPRLKIIAEHRGRFYQGCPENSICSINETSHEGVEAVEIDVRESADGTLWPIHDTNIGRVTNYSATGQLFSPYTQSAANSRNNPEIRLTHDNVLQNLKLRDPLGGVTSYGFVRLETMMRDADIRNRNLVYIFDIKTATAIGKTADIVKRLGIQDRSVLKFNSTLLAPNQVPTQTKGLHFVPVIGTGSLDYIADHYHLEQSQPSARINAYIYDYYRTAGFVYFEVRNKMFTGPRAGPPNQVIAEGPLSQVNFYMALVGIARGGYSPSPEHYATGREPGTGYYRLDGQCCVSLTDQFDQSRYFGRDSRDDRQVLHYVVSFNVTTISERGTAALDEARAIGARADQYKILY